MKFICGKDDLFKGISTVSKAISSRASLAVLECVKIEAVSTGEIVLTGTNMGMTIRYVLTGDVLQEGTVAFAARTLGEMIKSLPDSGIVTIGSDDNFITKISSDKCRFKTQGINAESFPALPEFEEIYSINVPQSTLKGMLKKALPFAAIAEGKKPILTGILLEIADNCINIVASDGHRLAATSAVLKESKCDKCVVIPRDALIETAGILSDTSKEIDIKLSDKYAMFSFENFQIYTRLLEGEFLNYKPLINNKNEMPTNAEINKNLLESALKRASLIISEDSKSDAKAPVKFDINSRIVNISCITTHGSMDETLVCEIHGNDLKIGFNCRFLLDALNGCDDKNVTLELSTPTSGVYIRSDSGDIKYTFMVLPVRLYQ